MRNVNTLYVMLLLLTLSFTTKAQQHDTSLNDDGTKKVTRLAVPAKTSVPVNQIPNQQATTTTVKKKRKPPVDSGIALPYYQYKGIQNLEGAKTEWIKDHPSAAQAKSTARVEPFTNYKGIQNAEQAKKEWIQDHPADYQAAPASQEPFVGYKGITDLREAKLAWLKDHPQSTN